MAPQTVDLVHRIEQLEERVRHLEQGHPVAPPVAASTPVMADPPAIDLADTAEGLVPLFGKALLALAGAYLLRTLTTSSYVPPWLGVGLAIAYPVFWMVMSTRLNKLVGAVYMAISVLAFAPMLWETTVNLRILPAWVAALVLAGYVICTLALARIRELNAIAWMAAGAGSVMAIALCFGTYDLAPFTFALLAMVAALEVAAIDGLWLGPRRVVAIATDLVILWLIDIYGRNAHLPEGYHAIPAWLGWGAPALLLVIFMAGTATRTLQRHWNVTVFETLELVAATGLFIFAATRQPGALLLPGLILIACGAPCYLLAFRRLIEEPLNLFAYSTFGFALVLLGTVFAIPQVGLVLALAAAVLLLVPLRAAEFHVIGFLIAGCVASGLAWDAYGTLLRDGTHVALTAGAMATSVTLGAAYSKLSGLPKALAATMFGWTSAAWLASILFGMLPAGAADGAWSATIRTSLIVCGAVVIALVTRYRHVRELYWLVPGAMAIALGRLVVNDMPVGRPETLFIALLFYGGALLVLSKLLRGFTRAA